MRMRLKVCYHDNCFDGLASAATFTRFFLQKVDPKAEVEYEGLAYRGKNPFREGLLSGDVNAILDFRYTRDPKLDWYFDHHVSAFQEPGDEEHFRADPSGQKFWNPEAKSCTKFMADVLRTRFGFEPGPMEQLIHWADIIDGAQFPDAKMAVELEEPALRLMTLIEAERETAFLHRIIRWMQEEPLAEIVARPEVAARIEPLLEAHRENVELIRQRAECENGVVYFDISDQLRDNANKFIPYHLFPDCRYSINVSASGTRTKISLGSNPWSKVPRTHDLAAIAARYGGGGHAVVAAISLDAGEAERARAIAREIVGILRRSQ